MTYELAQYRSCISRPISEENPVGELLSDNPLFEFIEEQMMKVGALSHGSVQWEKVECSILELLSQKTKDIKLLVHLLQCLHHQVSPVRFIVSIEVMSDFISQYWEKSFPVPGRKGARSRDKFFSLMIQRMSITIDKLDFSLFDLVLRSDLYEAIDMWQQVIEKRKLSSDLVLDAIESIQNGLRRAEPIQNSPPELGSVDIDPVSVTRSVDVDFSSDKNAKQTLLKVTDFLAAQEGGVALSIRLRRYAMWGAISSLPDHNPTGETILRGMNFERVKEYQDQLRKPSVGLWRKVEQSLTLSPFWFSGQLLSFSIAHSLNKPEWATAIADETSQFLQRMPSLYELHFKGGEPFVPDEVKEWLSALSHRQESSIGGDWNNRRKEALTQASEQGVEVALSMLNDELLSAKEPRDKAYWRLLSADLLHHNQLEAIAKHQYQSLYQQVSSLKVSDWEPSLLDRLEKHATSE